MSEPAAFHDAQRDPAAAEHDPSDRPSGPCPACVAASTNGDNFCRECGSRLSKQPAPDPAAPVDTSRPSESATIIRTQPRADAKTAPELRSTPAPVAVPVPPEPLPVCACGQRLPAEASFCYRCGLPVGQLPARYRLCSRTNGKGSVSVNVTEQDITIGKAPDCDLPVPEDDYVSRRHARVFHSDGMLFVEDLGSSNGTFLRVRRPIVLQAGDEILVGTSALRLEELGR